jgi:hypothetical protein
MKVSDGEVRIFRYLRFYDYNTLEVNPKSGVTFFFSLDYDKRIVKFTFAVHDSKTENFCKKTGRNIAWDRFDSNSFVFSFPMGESGISENGTLSDAIDYLFSKEFKFDNWSIKPSLFKEVLRLKQKQEKGQL